MYRKLVLLDIVLITAVLALGALARVLGKELLFNISSPQDLHIKGGAYAVVAISFVVFLISWWQSHCRMAAMQASIGVLWFLVCQIGLGIIILKNPNPAPLVLSAHLLFGMAVLWITFWLYLRSDPAIVRLKDRASPVLFARILMFVLLLQILLGNWVSLSQSALVCSGFPQCNGEWWPEADFQNAFENILAGRLDLSYLGQVALNWAHRVGALVCFVLLNWLMLVVTAPKYSKPLRKAGLWLSFLLFVQVALGVIGYKFAMPVGLVAGHTVFAALLMLPLIAISFYGRFGFGDAVAPVAEDQPRIETIEPAVAPKGLQPEAIAVDYEELYVEPAPESLYLRLKTQLAKTRTGIGSILENLSFGQKTNQDLLDDIEANLLMADVGVDVTTRIINHLTQSLERHQLKDVTALTSALKQELLGILAPCDRPLKIPKQDKPFVILVVGVNGVGKTTTIGKLAKRLKAQGHSVMLAAGDTFRAAAVEQLQTWGARNNIHVVAQHTGADSASVIYDGIQSAQSKGVDVLIADTAGRLHTKSNLMEELRKVKRIMAKLDETAPHEVLLVLDAGTGQNALSQAKQFNETIGLTGLALTKLDGTAKGGVIFAVAKQTGVPIRFIGVGEGIDDLQDFNAEKFVDALFVTD